MSSIPTRQIDGDVAVGRNVAMGGDATVRGHATVGHNLKVEGWLEARNIKGANKGLFETASQLTGAYPNPQEGWWALVSEGLTQEQLDAHLGQVYIAHGGEWKAQTDEDGSKRLGGNPTLDAVGYRESVESVNAGLEEAKEAIGALRDTQSAHGEAIDTLRGAVAEAAEPVVDISELDTLGTDGSIGAMLELANTNGHSRYRVKRGNLTVGCLDLFTDSSVHALTQVLTSNCILNNGAIDDSHECETVHTYFRTYNINAPRLTNEKWTWTEWKELCLEKAGKPDGFAPLDGGGRIPDRHLPEWLNIGVVDAVYDNTQTLDKHDEKLNQMRRGYVSGNVPIRLIAGKFVRQGQGRHGNWYLTKNYRYEVDSHGRLMIFTLAPMSFRKWLMEEFDPRDDNENMFRLECCRGLKEILWYGSGSFAVTKGCQSLIPGLEIEEEWNERAGHFDAVIRKTQSFEPWGLDEAEKNRFVMFRIQAEHDYVSRNWDSRELRYCPPIAVHKDSDGCWCALTPHGGAYAADRLSTPTVDDIKEYFSKADVLCRINERNSELGYHQRPTYLYMQPMNAEGRLIDGVCMEVQRRRRYIYGDGKGHTCYKRIWARQLTEKKIRRAVGVYRVRMVKLKSHRIDGESTLLKRINALTSEWKVFSIVHRDTSMLYDVFEL